MFGLSVLDFLCGHFAAESFSMNISWVQAFLARHFSQAFLRGGRASGLKSWLTERWAGDRESTTRAYTETKIV